MDMAWIPATTLEPENMLYRVLVHPGEESQAPSSKFFSLLSYHFLITLVVYTVIFP